MSQLTPEIAAEIVAACQANAADVGDALSRGLDEAIAVEPAEAADFDAAEAELAGPGLAMFFRLEGEAAVAMLPAASGLVPDWVKEPDTTGESKLATLAQELSMLLLPESLEVQEFKAGWLDDLAAGVKRCGMAESATLVPLALSAEGKQGRLSLIWPCSQPEQLLPATQAEPDQSDIEPTGEPTAQQTPQTPASGAPAVGNVLGQLPPYSRSLLQIEVTMTVRLAEKKQGIHDIVSLGPGSILSFDKSCDDPLEVTVEDEVVAHGEAVKVGEKFGVRLLEMVMPDERFKRVRKTG